MLKRTHKVTRPVEGNPNLVYEFEVDQEEEPIKKLRQKYIGNNNNNDNNAPKNVVEIDRRPPQVAELEEILQKILYNGLTTLYDFIGMVMSELGELPKAWINHFRWRPNVSREFLSVPLVRNCDSIKDCLEKNAFLGPAFLDVFRKAYLDQQEFEDDSPPLPSTIIPQATFRRKKSDRSRRAYTPGEDESMDTRIIANIGNNLNGGVNLANINSATARRILENSDWVFNSLDESIFGRLLSEPTWGALRISAAFVRRAISFQALTLHGLLMSKTIEDRLAQLVAHQLERNGALLYADTMNNRGTNRFRISAGIRHGDRLANQSQGLRYFFRLETAVVQHPRIAILQNQLLKVQRDKAELPPNSPAWIEKDQEELEIRFRRTFLPPYVLVYQESYNNEFSI